MTSGAFAAGFSKERIIGRKRYKPHWLISCTYLDTGESFTDDGPERKSFPYSVRS